MNPYLTVLKEKGLKITPLRRAILDVFQQRRSTLTAEQIWQAVRRRIRNAGLQSIYRNMAGFMKAGIMEEIFLEKRKAAFALCNGFSEHHHHAVCRRCGRSEEVEACGFDSVARTIKHSLRRLKKKMGFRVERHFLQLEGLCRACQK